MPKFCPHIFSNFRWLMELHFRKRWINGPSYCWEHAKSQLERSSTCQNVASSLKLLACHFQNLINGILLNLIKWLSLLSLALEMEILDLSAPIMSNSYKLGNYLERAEDSAWIFSEFSDASLLTIGSNGRNQVKSASIQEDIQEGVPGRGTTLQVWQTMLGRCLNFVRIFSAVSMDLQIVEESRSL